MSGTMKGGIERPPISAALVARLVADARDEDLHALRRPRGPTQTQEARQMAMWLCERLGCAPLAQIGLCFGGATVEAVESAIGEIALRRILEPTLARELGELEIEIVATALLHHRRADPIPRDPDPVTIAMRVIGSRRGAASLSIDEAEALAAAVLQHANSHPCAPAARLERKS